jgi:amino acid adenylation domain-containing protein
MSNDLEQVSPTISDWDESLAFAETATAVALLRQLAADRPNRRAATFLDSSGQEAAAFSFAELNLRARAIAAELTARNCYGERALLLYPPGTDFVAGFFGCLYAGVVAVPLPMPQPGRSPQIHDRIVGASRDARAKLALTNSRMIEKTRERLKDVPQLAGLDWIATDTIEIERAAAWVPPDLDGDSLAFLQYTSGSTSAPRGVMVSHRNLLHNHKLIAESAMLPEDGVEVSWLPTFHDMGLIAGHIHPILLGAHSVLISPATFLRKPLLWLQAITKYRAEASGGPDFAFDLCARTIDDEQKKNLDLSSWKVAFSGSEPVRAETLRRFARAFESCGFEPGTLFPCYGLAESTLLVAAKPRALRPTFLPVDLRALSAGELITSGPGVNGHEIVGCGVAPDGVTIRIMDPGTGASRGDGQVGEIWVRSESVAGGYWNRPDESEPLFRATSATGEGPYLRTGDLGVIHRGELFVTGRLKDLIIIRGQNYYPQDIEQTAEQSHDLVRPAAVAAFSIDTDGEEKLVVVLEADRLRRPDAVLDPTEIAAAVRKAVSEKFDLSVHAVVLLKMGSIPRTSSGKIQRRTCRESYLHGRLEVVAQDILHETEAPLLTREALLATEAGGRRARLIEHLGQSLAALLGIPATTIDSKQPVISFGPDSLRAMRWTAALEESLGVAIPLNTLASGGSLESIADFILSSVEGASPADPLIRFESDPEHRHEPFALTDIQQAYIAGRTSAYELGGIGCHVYFEFGIEKLDHQRLERAWNELVARHDMLRTVVRDGRQQVLSDVPEYRFAIQDLRDSANADAALLGVREELSDRIFEVGQWPLFDLRTTLLREGARLHFAIDLLIADASSLLLLFSEWMTLYQQGPEALNPIEVTFRDYVLAEQALKDHPRRRQSLEFWRNEVDALAPGPDLPLAKDPAAVKRPRFQRRTQTIDAATWSALKALAANQGLTPAGLLMAAYCETLARWSKRPQFTLNLTISNRLPLHPQIGSVIGDFTSVVLVPFDRTSGPDFLTRARVLQERLWKNLEHRMVSGVEVIRELAHRERGAHASMPVVFTSTLDTLDRARTDEAAAWLGDPLFGISRTPQVWLDHSVSERQGSLVLNWDAVEELFPAGMLDDFVAANAALLERLTRGTSAASAQDLEIIPPQQLARRRRKNQTDAPLSSMTLGSIFTETATLNPEQLAIVAGDRGVSYAELDRRSRNLAEELRRRGAKPNSLVAIVMEPGWEQVVAALGIVRSGAAYVPVDATLPAERRFRLLAHSEASIAITQPWLVDSIEWPDQMQRLIVNGERASEPFPHKPQPFSKDTDLGYVIYTSGSTGEPKGVMIDHRGAVNTILDINSRFRVRHHDRILALSSLSFDLSVYDLFGAFAAGAAIVHPERERRDPGAWAELIERERVTIWNSVPALMEMLVDSADARRRDLSSLRLVMLSGDWIPVSLPARIRELAPNAEIISLGGATEASIWSIYYPIGAVDPSWKSIPYGRPLLNQRFHVLNSSFEDAPEHVPGQLYIGGVGLARGYWRDEERTSRRFITHPRTGERLYDTGDLGRYLPDGDIEFLGREDFQVKIQGFRVELAEIEAALLQHDSVKSAVVNAVGDKQGHKRLVAYVVPKETPADDPAGVTSSGVGSVTTRLSVVDPEQRDRFKKEQRAVRTDLAGGAFIPLVTQDGDADTRFKARRSSRNFGAEALTIEELSSLLGSLRQIEIDGSPKRLYPSAGGLYPVQAYVHVKKGAVNGLEEGLYYFSPRLHQLQLLAGGAQLTREIHVPFNRPIFDSAGISIFLIGDLDAITPMYGELARDFCLLEAGYMSQLLMETAPDMKIGLCPIGAIAFGSVQHLFRLGPNHVLLHTLVGGRFTEDQPAIDELATELHPLEPGPAVPDGRLVDSLRSFIAAKLPRYMVPSSFVILESLPLSRNGKVDRSALPVPGNSAPRPAVQAPESGIEGQLKQIVSEVLKIDHVDRDANLFDLGANSIHLVQMHARAQELIGREFSVVDMFQHPSVAALARHLGGEVVVTEIEKSRHRASGRREALARRNVSRTQSQPPGESPDG